MRYRLLFLLLLVGCGAGQTTPSITFRTIHPLGLLGPVFGCQAGPHVVRDAAEWASFRSDKQFAESPAIDFSTEMAIVVVVGGRSSSGYTVDAGSVQRDGQRLVVRAIERTPGPCVTLPVVTCPWAVVVVPRTADDVGVEWTTVPRTSCS